MFLEISDCKLHLIISYLSERGDKVVPYCYSFVGWDLGSLRVITYFQMAECKYSLPGSVQNLFYPKSRTTYSVVVVSVG